MADDKPSTHPSWLKLGGLGCAAAIGLIVLFFGGLAGLTFWGYNRALAVREEVDRNYGAYDSYRVPADGRVPAESMARFLAIRRALMPRCAEVTGVTGRFRAVDDMAKQDEPDVGELFRRVGRLVRTVPSVGLVFGEYITDRNNALRDNRMGLGEYTWIYAVSYLAHLGQLPRSLLAEKDLRTVFLGRVYPEMGRVIERHIAARGLGAGPWVDELARLKADGERVPFRGTLPPELAASLEPHRDALTSVACPAAAELDLAITVRRNSFGYDHR